MPASRSTTQRARRLVRKQWPRVALVLMAVGGAIVILAALGLIGDLFSD